MEVDSTLNTPFKWVVTRVGPTTVKRAVVPHRISESNSGGGGAFASDWVAVSLSVVLPYLRLEPAFLLFMDWNHKDQPQPAVHIALLIAITACV
jgi:hypothetical protein